MMIPPQVKIQRHTLSMDLLYNEGISLTWSPDIHPSRWLFICLGRLKYVDTVVQEQTGIAPAMLLHVMLEIYKFVSG